ncbi:hypothetical protein AAHH67_15245 [Niallia circulans]
MTTNYMGLYQKYLRVPNSQDDPITLANKQAAIQEFDGSYFTKQVIVDNVEYIAMVKQEKKDEDKKLIFKPDVKVNKGSVVTIGDLYYLINNFLGDGVYEIYPTATLKQCNSFFPAITDKTRVLIGRDDDGRPVYEEVEQKVNVPCIVEPSISINTDKVDQLLLPKGSIKISLKYAKYMNINSNDKFEMYGNRYEIEDIDYSKVINEIGIMVIYAKKDVKES